jgi:hypothetical protein
VRRAVLVLALLCAGCGATKRAPEDQPTVGTPPPIATPKPTATPRPPADQLRTSLRTLRRLPQTGLTLGRPHASVTLNVYVALDAFSDRFFASDLPELVRRWVKPGRLELTLQPDGRGPAAQAAQSAALQHRAWQFWAATSARYDGALDPPEIRRALQEAGVKPKRHERRQIRRLTKRTAAATAGAATDLPAYTVSVDGSAPQPLDACGGLCLVPALATVIDG